MSTGGAAGHRDGTGDRGRSRSAAPALLTPSCRYLFLAGGQEPTDLTNQWLEWEATELQVGGWGAVVGSGSWPRLPDPPLSRSALCSFQPVVAAALYAQLVHGKKGLEAAGHLGKLLAYIEQSLSGRGTAYLAGVSGTPAWGKPALDGGIRRAALSPGSCAPSCVP